MKKLQKKQRFTVEKSEKGVKFAEKRDFPRSTRKNFQKKKGLQSFGDALRIQKVLAQKGVASRREIERLIAAGRIQVNGKVATLGQKISARDLIKIDGRLVDIKSTARAATPRLLLYHKHEGEIVSRADPEHRPSVFTRLPRLRGARWISIGRLDFNTSGLLLFTTSGDLANRLMHPSFKWEREYSVRVLGELTESARANLLNGVVLDDGNARFLALDDLGGTGANRWYRVVLEEGRNREVRRLFESQGLTVSRLIRTRFGDLRLPPRLKRGKHYELPPDDVRKLLTAWEFVL